MTDDKDLTAVDTDLAIDEDQSEEVTGGASFDGTAEVSGQALNPKLPPPIGPAVS
jgi:hypothetical protein